MAIVKLHDSLLAHNEEAISIEEAESERDGGMRIPMHPDHVK